MATSAVPLGPAGVPPFPDGPFTERIYKHVSTPPPNSCTLNPDVPPGLAAVVRRTLEKKPVTGGNPMMNRKKHSTTDTMKLTTWFRVMAEVIEVMAR